MYKTNSKGGFQVKKDALHTGQSQQQQKNKKAVTAPIGKSRIPCPLLDSSHSFLLLGCVLGGQEGEFFPKG